MSQKVPDNPAPSESQRALDARQLRALESLLGGSTATEAALAAGVDRRTLFRWQRTDSEFQAALNRGRREIRDAAELRLERLATSAVAALEKALEEGDARSALAVLRGLGLMSSSVRIVPDEADVIEWQARINESERKKAAFLAELAF